MRPFAIWKANSLSSEAPYKKIDQIFLAPASLASGTKRTWSRLKFSSPEALHAHWALAGNSENQLKFTDHQKEAVKAVEFFPKNVF